MKLALLDKFSHWSEVLSVLTYADPEIPFVSHKRLSEGECYVDPLGKTYINTITPRYAADQDRCLVINGSLHLETHPLSKGKIPYPKLPYKIAIEHTVGYSPWDFLQMVELSEISASHSEDAKGSKVLYLMNKKCYDRFMMTDWNRCGKSYYTPWKSRINELVSKGYVCPTFIEPAQFWVENVPHTLSFEKSDHICLCLNWCNINKVVKVEKVSEICKKLHDYTGKDIDIRLHSYSREGLFHYLEALPYVHLIPYLSMSKYDIMDKYDIYFVDGTGLGYEIAYRNYFNKRPVDIFYLSGLSGDDSLAGFDGIVEMGATPEHDWIQFVKGFDHSNFSREVILESFPHESGNVPSQCFDIITRYSDKIADLP